MQNAVSRNDIQKRLRDLSYRIAEYRAKIESPHHKLGQHIGHLVELEHEYETLSRTFSQADQSAWEQMAQTFEADFNGLISRFGKWVKNVDEEFKQTS